MYILIVDLVYCFREHLATIFISIDRDKFAAFCARAGLTAGNGTVTACRTAAGVAVCPVQSGSVTEVGCCSC
jgi:hypothetical protein